MAPCAGRLSPDDSDAHYFFGYYDVPAYSADEKHHLAHRVRFMDRVPATGDVAEIGIIERQSSSFTPLAHTAAWNFQQGAMLQWLPGSTSEVVYNIGEDGCFRGCILDIHNGRRKVLDRPVASVDSTGHYALSINFSRMFDFRPGYGYAGIPDRWQHDFHPEVDGVHLLDLRHGSSKLILSLQQIWECTRQWLPGGDQKLLINHLTFSPSGERFVMLVRYFPEPGKHYGGKTAVLTARADGSGLRAVTEGYRMASHYHWKDDRVLLIYADGPQGNQLYEWNVETLDKQTIDTEFFVADGHCSYSPDRSQILYDSYPQPDGCRYLSLYDLTARRGWCLSKLHTVLVDGQARCDLHPRWSRCGRNISIDSTHEGHRHIYEFDVENFPCELDQLEPITNQYIINAHTNHLSRQTAGCN